MAMAFGCSMISCVAITIFGFLFWLESKRKLDFSSKLGTFITYFMDFLLILFFFYIYLKYDGPYKSDSIIKQQLFECRFDIGMILLIAICNALTKILLKCLCENKDLKHENRTYKNIMYGLISIVGIIGIVCKDLKLFSTVMLLLVGSHIDFSLHKSKEDKPNKTDIAWYVGTIIVVTLFVFFIFECKEILLQYAFYFLAPWLLLLIVSLVTLIILLIKNKDKIKKLLVSKFYHLLH